MTSCGAVVIVESKGEDEIRTRPREHEWSEKKATYGLKTDLVNRVELHCKTSYCHIINTL
jgi:hypothetical protein